MTGAFETLGAVGGELPFWDLHMARLTFAAGQLGLAFDPPFDLEARALALLASHGHDVVRITFEPGRAGVPEFDLATRARPTSEVVVLHRVSVAGEFAGPAVGFKSTSRELYDRALAEARAAGADDAVLIDQRGRVLETSTANLFVAVGDELCTPPLDGAILPGIARAVLLDGLAAAGRPVVERDVSLEELVGAEQIWVTNAVHGPRPAALTGGQQPLADPLLGEVWSAALASA